MLYVNISCDSYDRIRKSRYFKLTCKEYAWSALPLFSFHHFLHLLKEALVWPPGGIVCMVAHWYLEFDQGLCPVEGKEIIYRNLVNLVTGTQRGCRNRRKISRGISQTRLERKIARLSLVSGPVHRHSKKEYTFSWRTECVCGYNNLNGLRSMLLFL